jgi:hypothetical protein
MNNEQLHNDPLFQAAQKRLSDLETPYDGADWDAMSRRLDALPKSSSFRWRYSLNALLIALAVGGAAYGAYAYSTRASSAEQKQQPITTTTPTKSEATPSVPTSNPIPSNPVAETSQELASANQGQTNADAKQQSTSALQLPGQFAREATQVKKVKPRSGLLFGDQIDPRKGFVYQTAEADSLIEESKKMGRGAVPYYDANEKGEVKRVDLKQDSSGLKGELKDKNKDQPFPAQPFDTSGTAPVYWMTESN